MKILVSDAFDPSLPERLQQFGEVTDDQSMQDEADVVLIRSKTKVTREYIDAAPNLKLVIRGGVGLDNVDLEYAKEKGIAVHNTPEASSVAVAELAFAMMLAVPSRLVEAHNSMREGRWDKKSLKRTELMGKTLGLIGVGRISTEVARRAAAFGMNIIGYDKYVSSHDLIDMKSFDILLAEADYLSLHVPLTPETENLIDADAIARMKDGAVVVNTGRGKCVHAESMVSALESGKIAVYATDVWPSDPPPEEYPVLNAPNVLMAPHIGASTQENLLRIGDQVVDIITKFTQ